MGSFFVALLLSASLDIDIQPSAGAEKDAEIAAWVTATADTIKLAYGRFPNPNVRVVVITSTTHSWGSDSPVTYGRVTRNGGEKVELFVNPDRPIEEFYQDWTATHEFSHLMLPLLDRRYRWISEGFATYYQNVLMSRAGRYTPEFAWQRIAAGLDRGTQSRPDLSPNDAASAGVRHARMKVYWSGAAIALLADIELRQRSNGEESLDTALGKLQRCCLPASRRWTGPELFRRLDSFVSSPVFMPLYRQYADSEGFPDMTDALLELGVEWHADETVTLDNDRSLADLRQAIMAPR